MPLIIKTVGVTVYGGYILVSTIVGLIYGISSFGVGFKSGRFLPATEGREARSAIFYPQFCFQLLSLAVLSLIFIVLYPFINSVFFKKEVIFLKWLVFPWFIFNFLYSQAVGYFISTHRINHFNYATIVFPYLNIALIVLVYLFTHRLSINILFITQILSYIVLAVPLFLMLFREIGFKFMISNVKDLISDIKLGFPLRVDYIMDFLLSSSDRYLITYFMTVTAVGYYNPGYALGSLIIFFPRVSGVVLIPLLSKSIDNGKHLEAQNMLNYTIKGFLLMAIPFVFGAAVLSGPLLYLFANAEVSQKAYLVTPVVATATLFFGLNIILSNALWVKMKTAIMLKMNMLAAVINLVLNLILLYIFKNVLVAAFTTLISYVIVFLSIRKVVTKDWAVSFEANVIMKSIIASAIMGAILYFMLLFVGKSAYKVWFILGEMLFGVMIYIAALFAMKVFSEKELKYLGKVFS